MLYLACNVFTDNTCIKLRTLNFKNIDLNIFLIELFQLFFQFVYILTTFTYDDTRAGCANSDGNKF